MAQTGNPIVAATMGEPQGIGPELLISLYRDRAKHKLKPFCVYGNADFLERRAKTVKRQVKFIRSSPERAEADFEFGLPVIDIEGDIPDTPGEPHPEAAGTVVAAIEQATADTLAGLTKAVLTAPIHKATLYDAGFEFPGHTEFIAQLCRSDEIVPHPVMMLASSKLRTVPVTVHVPIVEVPWRLSSNLIAVTARTVNQDLKERFGVKEPRLAILGLNPHAGEAGAIGDQEETIIWPAIAALSQEGIDVDGPLSPDTAFAPHIRQGYDAIIAMYHDQALIPIKALAFDTAVNVTLGLPIVRTSPDHGTAFELAGKSEAKPNSMVQAFKLAERLTK